MEKIQFDVGQRSYRINGAGTLRFNPCDPNVYSRFLEAVSKLQAVEEELTLHAQEMQDADIVKALSAADEKMKGILNWVFGGDTTGYQIPFTIHYTGEKVKGTFNVSTRTFTAA